MNLIYLYPTGTTAPSKVAFNILEYISKNRDKLPFDDVKLLVKRKNRKEIFGFETISLIDLQFEKEKSVIHIPQSMLIMPNAKFCLFLFSILRNNKLILNCHSDTRMEMNINWEYQKRSNISYIPTYIFLPYLLRAADKLIVNSYKTLYFLKKKYPINNEVIIPNGINDFWFKKNDFKVKLDGNPSIFYHGRLSPEKGVDLLIKAFLKVVRKEPMAKLYIAGDGPLKQDLNRLIKNNGADKNIEFLGSLDENKIKSYLMGADAAIYPSRYDSFPLSFLEAFSTIDGPVYYSSRAGTDDFVKLDGKCLNSFEPTIENICSILEDIIKNNVDHTNLIYDQKEFARKFTWDEVGKKYLEMYESVMDI